MIEDSETGELLSCEVQLVSLEEVESLEPGWNFDWSEQIRQAKSYKLVSHRFPDEILGLMSVERKPDYIEVLLH